MFHARAGPGTGDVPQRRSRAAGGEHLESGRAGHRHRGPDLYSANQPDWIKWYRANDKDNPLFIPETDSTRGAYHVFYALGQHDAMGYAPFAIDELLYSPASGAKVDPADLPLAKSYATAGQLAPVILEYQGKGKMAGAVVSADDPAQKIALGDYVLDGKLSARAPRPARGARRRSARHCPGAAPPTVGAHLHFRGAG